MSFVISSARRLSIRRRHICNRIHAEHRLYSSSTPRPFFTKQTAERSKRASSWTAVILSGSLFIWWLYPTDEFAQLSVSDGARNRRYRVSREGDSRTGQKGDGQDLHKPSSEEQDQTAWAQFSRRIESFSLITDQQWSALSDRFVDYFLPEWSKIVPGQLQKLQRELSMSPGSLADEIWQDAHNPAVHPEIDYSAQVRVGTELCQEEKQYLERRKRVARVALAKYIGVDVQDVHPDDVPTIAMCGSGGGLRALIAGSGSLKATEEDGLFDCVTYTSGVSGSCWLQLLYMASFTNGSIGSLLEHLKARASTHIAYPPVAFDALTSMPTNKYLLSGMVEKLKGDPEADFGLVDAYGLLLGARYLVPKGELGIDSRDFKISSQRRFLKHGQFPLPIYTAVRHEIPDLEETSDPEAAKDKAKKEAWFQWYEITPYEFFCEEFAAGVPTWALGRNFENGKDMPPEHGFHLPEMRTPILMGIFGSAFCATLSHYYKEIRPLVQSVSGFKSVDGLISGRNEDLSKVHPIDPASIPNFVYKMYGQLPSTTPKSLLEKKYIQLMDAGMSNNLPIYPLLRPGREVDIVIAFDASADIKTDNWLSVADGYARQRGIKGWPVGIGWPKLGSSAERTAQELEEAQAKSSEKADRKVEAAKRDQEALRKDAGASDAQRAPKGQEPESKFEPGDQQAGDLGYCTVWVGTTAERTASPPPPSKALKEEEDAWMLMEPDAGISVVYLPFLSNKKVPDISPGTSDFLSTWNFVYTPEQIDKVVQLARANYDEGRQQIKATIKAVYERKKKAREQREGLVKRERVRRMVKKDGDQFS